MTLLMIVKLILFAEYPNDVEASGQIETDVNSGDSVYGTEP